jgi:bifunctional non-homologous end joining protein LigD
LGSEEAVSAAIAHPFEHRSIEIPRGSKEADITIGRRTVHLTNLQKVFCPRLGLKKRDLLQYYADIAPVLFPHLSDRAMVMKRVPASRPDWIETCPIEHASAGVIDFPLVQDLASLLWIVNLGCIDLNPWYATSDDVYRPDYLHFDLDPTPGATFQQVTEAALAVRRALAELEIESYAKTSGSRGIHIYVPIVRGPKQHEVWKFTEAIAKAIEAQRPNLITAEYRASKRPKGRVLVDFNQNGRCRTLASVYSVRPTLLATVSTPVSWDELERGIDVESFRMPRIPARIRAIGDLWKPLLQKRGRLLLERLTG